MLNKICCKPRYWLLLGRCLIDYSHLNNVAFQGKHTIADTISGFGNINPHHKLMPLNTFDFLFYQGCGRGKDKDGVGDMVGANDRVRVGPWPPSPHLWLQIIKVGVRQSVKG